jgi:hypothetical protein
LENRQSYLSDSVKTKPRVYPAFVGRLHIHHRLLDFGNVEVALLIGAKEAERGLDTHRFDTTTPKPLHPDPDIRLIISR